jgi:hypothetical protein
MKLVRSHRAFIQDVIDGVILCYTPTFTPQLKAIESRIKLISRRYETLQKHDWYDRDVEQWKEACKSELRMLYADKERTLTMSASVERKAIDRNLHKLHKAAQYLYRWGFIETYTITKGMIEGVWFDRYVTPERITFSTIKWEVTVQNTWHINTPWYQASNDGYKHEHITKDTGQFERDKMSAQEERERMFHNPTPHSEVFNGDMQWDKNQHRVKPIAHQNTAKTLIRRIRRVRKMPLFTEAFKQWKE